MLGLNVVYCQLPGFFSAVLAFEVVASEDFLLGKFDAGPGTLDNLHQTDDGGFGIGPGHGANHTTAIHDHVGFSDYYQAHRPAG